MRGRPCTQHARAIVALALALAGCGDDDGPGGSAVDAAPGPDGEPDAEADVNVLPAFISGDVRTATYDGETDDLLTAGLGRTGLAGAPPEFADPSAPTAAELRRRAIYTNYRALVDMTSTGGFGRFWGPNVDLDGNDTLGEGRIAGTETIALARGDAETASATLLVQVPDSFAPEDPCIVTAPSSGSRGVYGAISAVGEWGLKRGCAVAYTDKGTGNGAHELATDTVTLIDGSVSAAAEAGDRSLFSAAIAESERDAFVAEWPYRYAYKHAHSQVNPEKDWGASTLQAIQFAYWVLNESFGAPVPGGVKIRYRPGDIRTIAGGVSNGGGAALAAAELDTEGWITAVVVGEPQVNVDLPEGLSVEQGGTAVPFGSTLFEYVTAANLLEPCAAHAASAAGAPLLATVPVPVARARCAALAADGLVSGADFESRAADALARLRASGFLPDSDLLHAAMWGLEAVPAVSVTYADAYARAGVLENLCGFSFGPTDAATGMAGVPPASPPMPALFAVANGIPPTAGINLVYNDGEGGPAVHTRATADASHAGAACLRDLLTGEGEAAVRLRRGLAEIRRAADLHGVPALIVQGRSDALVPVNHTSRPYLGANRIIEGEASRLSLYEIANGQHFDALLGVAGFDTRFVPVHHYYLQALDLMWEHLSAGAALPPSQVVRATARGGTDGAAPPLAIEHLPPIQERPGADAITFSAGTLSIPD